MAVHPWSHRVPIDSSGWRRVGNMWAVRAASGRVGKFIVAVCVAFSVEPSGRRTVIPLEVAFLSRTSVFVGRKCPVHPVSAIEGLVLGGGRL